MRTSPEGARGAIPVAWWNRQLGWLFAHVVYSCRAYGLEHIPSSGPVLLAANHASVLDGPSVHAVSPRPVHFLVKQEMFRGLLGRFLTRIGQIPIDRSHGDRTALAAALGVLRAGQVCGVFPEGARGRGDVSEVRAGVAWLALQSGAPVVPVACLGTRRTGESAGHVARPRRRIHVVFGAPFTVQRPSGVPGRAVMSGASEQVRAALSSHVIDALQRTGMRLPEDAGWDLDD